MQLVGPLPEAGVVDETIRRTVVALLHGRSIRKEDLTAVLGCSRGTVFNKLAATDARPFTASEVARLAVFFEVPITDLYDGLGGRFVAQPSHLGSEGWGFESLRARSSSNVIHLADRRPADRRALALVAGGRG